MHYTIHGEQVKAVPLDPGEATPASIGSRPRCSSRAHISRTDISRTSAGHPEKGPRASGAPTGRPLTGGSGYGPPTCSSGYEPPTGGSGYGPPTCGSGYEPPTGGSGYGPPTCGSGYEPLTGGSGYGPPTGGNGYETPTGDSGRGRDTWRPASAEGLESDLRAHTRQGAEGRYERSCKH